MSPTIKSKIQKWVGLIGGGTIVAIIAFVYNFGGDNREQKLSKNDYTEFKPAITLKVDSLNAKLDKITIKVDVMQALQERAYNESKEEKAKIEMDRITDRQKDIMSKEEFIKAIKAYTK